MLLVVEIYDKVKIFVGFASYFVLFKKSLVGQDSQKISDTDDTSQSTDGDPSPKKDPEGNKPNKPSVNSKNLIKSPVYPDTPVKVYQDASVSKSDIYKDFKDVSIIYM